MDTMSPTCMSRIPSEQESWPERIASHLILSETQSRESPGWISRFSTPLGGRRSLVIADDFILEELRTVKLSQFTNDIEIVTSAEVGVFLLEKNPVLQGAHFYQKHQLIILQALYEDPDPAVDSIAVPKFTWFVAIDYRVQEFSPVVFLSIQQALTAGIKKIRQMIAPPPIVVRGRRMTRKRVFEHALGQGMPQPKRRLRWPHKK